MRKPKWQRLTLRPGGNIPHHRYLKPGGLLHIEGPSADEFVKVKRVQRKPRTDGLIVVYVQRGAA